jgi:hypothetical protein
MNQTKVTFTKIRLYGGFIFEKYEQSIIIIIKGKKAKKATSKEKNK